MVSETSKILDIIEEAMLERGVSRSELARRMGVHRSTVTNFFNRERVSVDYEVVSRCFAALGMGIYVDTKEESDV